MPAIRTRQDTLPTGLLLAGAGGFLDAYTFVGRGGVFANAQTGNIVLLGAEAGERHWLAALLHVPPILAFMLGVALAETLARPAGRRIVRRPARFVLVAEIVVLAIVGALPPQVPDQVVTAAIAFASALQVSTFRSLQGIDYSTTLTTSNLRTLVAKAHRWCVEHDAQAGRQAARIAAVVAPALGNIDVRAQDGSGRQPGSELGIQLSSTDRGRNVRSVIDRHVFLLLQGRRLVTAYRPVVPACEVADTGDRQIALARASSS